MSEIVSQKIILFNFINTALYVNGNGHPPRAMRSLESLNCVEMKVLVGMTGVDGHLDTKVYS